MRIEYKSGRLKHYELALESFINFVHTQIRDGANSGTCSI